MLRAVNALRRGSCRSAMVRFSAVCLALHLVQFWFPSSWLGQEAGVRQICVDKQVPHEVIVPCYVLRVGSEVPTSCTQSNLGRGTQS